MIYKTYGKGCGYFEAYDFDPDTRIVRFWVVSTNRWSLPVGWDSTYEDLMPEDYVEWLPDN